MGSVTKTIEVDAPVAQVFAFWKNFENFPRFMDNIESIQVIGPDLTHWKSKGPLGMNVEWDARTTYVEENKKIAWQSTDGQVETHGAVIFKELGTGRTEVTVGLEYTPPGGAIGEAVAKLFADPDNQLDADLARFKTVAESGDFVLMAGDTTAGTEATSTGHYGPSDTNSGAATPSMVGAGTPDSRTDGTSEAERRANETVSI